MTITYENIESLVPNATMRKRYTDGQFRSYLIKPNDGYVMHDSGYDYFDFIPVLDEEGNPVFDDSGYPMEEVIRHLGYRPTEASVSHVYDWTPVDMLDEAGNTVTAYGARQFFCKPVDEVPADQIFGVTQPDHEVM